MKITLNKYIQFNSNRKSRGDKFGFDTNIERGKIAHQQFVFEMFAHYLKGWPTPDLHEPTFL